MIVIIILFDVITGMLFVSSLDLDSVTFFIIVDYKIISFHLICYVFYHILGRVMVNHLYRYFKVTAR